MIMYKGNSKVNADKMQVKALERSGWSTTFLEEKKVTPTVKVKEQTKVTPTTATTAKPAQVK